MLRASAVPARSWLDRSLLATATLYLAATVFFLWRAGTLDPAHAGPAVEFAARFARFSRGARISLFLLGALSTIQVVAALVREGGLGRRRGRLRLLALVALAASAAIGALVVQPIGEAVLQAAAGPADTLASLFQRWQWWRRAHLASAAVAAAALLLADRAPRVVRPASPDDLTPHHRRLLLLLGTATFFEGYDRFVVALALPYIARDLGAGDAQLGWALAAIRSGALPALLLGRAADRVGRRRLLLMTILAYTIATAATGLSRGLVAFVLLQMTATVFLSAELALAQVVIAEEFPARARGFGQGLLGAAQAAGGGLAAGLIPVMVGTTLGWRGLYFVGIVPLLIVGYLRRALPETTRWQHLDEADRLRPTVLGVLAPSHRRRALVLMVATASLMGAVAAAYGFAAYRATTTFEWPPGRVSAMVLVGGGLGFSGWFIFGRLVDALGRRGTGAAALVGVSVAILVFYATHYLSLAYCLLVFFESGAAIALAALSTEAFPTALRATARTLILVAGLLGGMLSLAAVGALASWAGGHAPVIAAVGVLPALLAPLIFLLPETRGEELEAS